MQKIEVSLVEQAVKFELIDTIGKRELDRIREDRHLCAHPSLRAEGEVYNPRPEAARGHLAIALSTLLVHPPTQGRKLLEVFKNFICDPLFTPAPSHIRAAFHDRVRTATRKSIIQIAARAAILELDPDGRMPADLHADRMAVALRAFAEDARDAVRDAVGEVRERLQIADGAIQLRTLVRMAEDDYFWTSVDQPLATRLQALVEASNPEARWSPLPADIAAALSVVGSSYARGRLPGLEVQFGQLSEMQQRQVIGVRPAEFFVPKVIEMLSAAGSWRTGEEAGRLLLLHARFLTIDGLNNSLTAWYQNSECREASEMPELAVQLLHSTAHLGAARGPPFVEFTVNCTAATDMDYYTYPDLKVALQSLSLWSPPSTGQA